MRNQGIQTFVMRIKSTVLLRLSAQGLSEFVRLLMGLSAGGLTAGGAYAMSNKELSGKRDPKC